MARFSNAYYIKNDGTLWFIGDNAYGQAADGTTTDVFTPLQITSPAKSWKQVCTGDGTTLALAQDGTLWTIGVDRGSVGIHGLGSSGETLTTFTQIGTDTDWTQISMCHRTAIAIKGGNNYTGWGDNSDNQIVSGGGTINAPSAPSTTDDFNYVVNGDKSSWAIRNSGEIYVRGDIVGGASWTRELPPITDITDIRGDMQGVMALQSTGDLWVQGINHDRRWTNEYSNEGTVDPPNFVDDTNSRPTAAVAMTARPFQFSAASIIVRTNGTAWSCGENGAGSAAGWLGLGDTNDRQNYTQIGAATDWTDCSASLQVTYLLNSAGELYAAGSNIQGACGQASGGPFLTHVLVDTNVSVILDRIATAPPPPPVVALNYSIQPNFYSAVLTGAPDATTDYTLPLKRVTVRQNVGGQESIRCVIAWSLETATAIQARPNGELVISHTQGATVTELARIVVDEITTDQGASNRSISLYAEQSYAPGSAGTYSIPSVAYSRNNRWRFPPLPIVKSGDNVTRRDSSESMLVSQLVLTVAPNSATFEIEGVIT